MDGIDRIDPIHGVLSHVMALFTSLSDWLFPPVVTGLKRNTVIQKERIVLSADVADAVPGIERARLRNDN